jgi:hypothetical protein
MSRVSTFIRDAVNPALQLLPPHCTSDRARFMLATIGLQESRLEFRFQKTSNRNIKGPARGLLQFEEGGGVAGVMSHPVTNPLAIQLCDALGVPFVRREVWEELERDDILAAGFGRLLLLSDPRPLPGPDDHPDATWAYYTRNWRPGKEHRETWDAFHFEAAREVFG